MLERNQVRPVDVPVAPSFTDAAKVQIETRKALTQVLGIGVGYPDRWYSQTEILERLGYAQDEKAHKIASKSCIDGRYLFLDDEDFTRTADPRWQDAYHRRGTLALAEKAIRKARDAQPDLLERLGCLIVHTTSGFQMPGLSTQLITRMGLPLEIERFDLVGMGCLGSIPLVSLADKYLAMNPNKLVLAVTSEIGSHFLRANEHTNTEAIVINSLFGDAAVAVVLGRTPEPSAGVQVVDMAEHQAADTLDIVDMHQHGDGSTGAHLGRDLPARASALFGPALEKFLDKHAMRIVDVDHWIFHPGGRAILDQMQADLGLPDEKMAASRDTLRLHGNCSSSTALLALNRTLETTTPFPGDRGILAVVGPGLTVGFALLRWD